MNRSWAKRTAELHDELSAITKADLPWWLLAGGVAAIEPWGEGGDYVSTDANPTGDTFIGYRSPAPADPIADAIARARAARTAVRELDDQLPEQPLAVTLRIGPPSHNGHPLGDGQYGEHTKPGGAAVIVPSALDVAAFAIGDTCVIGRLDDPQLPAQIAAAATGATPARWTGATPFVCVSIGDDSPTTARHGHRRGWRAGSGPWLGLGRAGALATVSTCHLVVDGYGHGRITGRIAELAAVEEAVLAVVGGTTTRVTKRATIDLSNRKASDAAPLELPPLDAVQDAIPLGVAWRELPNPAPRALALGYALGRVLHRRAGKRDAKFSPTFQIPVAPGDRDDPLRIRRRVVAGIIAVRFDGGVPEPYAVFEARAKAMLAREAAGYGLISRLLNAARAVPVPLAFKRKSIGATRARWLDRLAEVVGGRACLSKISVDAPLPASCAVSSPARIASAADPLGSCVITVLEDADRSAITACGSGLAGTTASATALIDELLSLT